MGAQRTMRAVTTLMLTALLFVAVAARGASKDDLERLVKAADLAYLSDTAAAVVSMDIHTRSYDRHYEIVSWDDRRGSDKTLIKILGPALYRGHGTLKIGNRLKLYNPNTNHVTLVSSSMLGNRWMGSHFTNDDLVKSTELADDYHLELLDKGRARVNGRDVTRYRIKLTPKPTAPVAWATILYELWESGDAVVPERAAYFRKRGSERPERTIEWSKVGTLAGRTVPKRMEVTVTDKPGEYTRIDYDELRLNVDIPASKFTEQALRK